MGGGGGKIFSNKILAVVSFLGHLSTRKFSDRTNRLGSNIRQREGAGCWGGGGVATTVMDFFLPIFLTIKMKFNLNNFGME